MNEMRVFDIADIEKLRRFKKESPFGYVYLVDCESSIKIGRTSEPYKRIKDLRHIFEDYNGKKVWRVAVSIAHTNYYENEIKLHKMFSAYREQHSEMFSITLEHALEKINSSKMQFLYEHEEIKKKEKKDAFHELSTSQVSELIDEWIFSERDRGIIKRRLLDGITHEQLAKEFDLSIQAIKGIVYTTQNKLIDMYEKKRNKNA